MDIINFKLKDFLKQDINTITDYFFILNQLEPIPTKKEVYYLKLKEVEHIKTNINSGLDKDIVDIISLVQDVKKEDILDLDIIQVFGLINSVKEQVLNINKAETNALSNNIPNVKFEQVEGSKRLQKFGIYNTLNQLSDGNILKWDAILELPYDMVFTKLYLDKTNNDIQYEISQIKSAK